MSPLTRTITAVIGLALGCHSQVLSLDDGGRVQVEDCPASPDWLTATLAPALETPAPHPDTECPFHQMAVQQFLLASRPVDGAGEPAFAAYPSVDDLFDRSQPLPADALAPVGTHRGTQLRAWLGNVKQPGLRQMLIDKNGHTLYYGSHVNDAMADFVNASGLRTSRAIQNVDPLLQLPPGIVELESAWQDIDPADGAAGDYSGFITTRAWVSTLHRDPVTGAVTEDRDHPREIRVALLELHVAFTLPGHPELILSTFEHIDSAGAPDAAPSAPYNPAPEASSNSRRPRSATETSCSTRRARRTTIPPVVCPKGT